MNLAKYFDHTNLSPLASRQDIEVLCQEARTYGFFSVCVQPSYVAYARELLADTDVSVATVVGFPQGQNTAKSKAYEAKDAIEKGADEIDMVMNFAALKDGRYDEVEEEIALVKEACGDKILKVIFETSQLTDDEILKACQLSDRAGVDFIKTSTGFLGQGAQVSVVKLMKENSQAQVKASGGIRCLADSLAMIEAGATRLGASAGAKIMQEYTNENL